MQQVLVTTASTRMMSKGKWKGKLNINKNWNYIEALN